MTYSKMILSICPESFGILFNPFSLSMAASPNLDFHPANHSILLLCVSLWPHTGVKRSDESGAHISALIDSLSKRPRDVSSNIDIVIDYGLEQLSQVQCVVGLPLDVGNNLGYRSETFILNGKSILGDDNWDVSSGSVILVDVSEQVSEAPWY